MQLPVEQYYELDPAMIRPLGGTRFALQVPRVNVGIFPHFWRAQMLPLPAYYDWCWARSAKRTHGSD